MSARAAFDLVRSVVSAPRAVGSSMRRRLRAQVDRWNDAPETAFLGLAGHLDPELFRTEVERLRSRLLGPAATFYLTIFAGGFAAFLLAWAETVIVMIIGLAALYAAVTFGSSLIRSRVLDSAVDSALNVLGTAVLALIGVEIAVNVLSPHIAGGLIAHGGIVHKWIGSNSVLVHGVALGLFALVVAGGQLCGPRWVETSRRAYSIAMALFGAGATITLCISLVGLAPETGERALLRDPVVRQRMEEAAARAEAAAERDEANRVARATLEASAEVALGRAFIAQLTTAVIQTTPTAPEYVRASSIMKILKPDGRNVIRFSDPGGKSWIDVVPFRTTCCGEIIDGLDDHQVLHIAHEATKAANDPGEASDVAKFAIAEAITSLTLPGFERSGDDLSIGAAGPTAEDIVESLVMQSDLRELYSRFSDAWSHAIAPAQRFRQNLRSWKRFPAIARHVLKIAAIRPSLTVSSGVARPNRQHDKIAVSYENEKDAQSPASRTNERDFPSDRDVFVEHAIP